MHLELLTPAACGTWYVYVKSVTELLCYLRIAYLTLTPNRLMMIGWLLKEVYQGPW
jgi:hypothetical protein